LSIGDRKFPFGACPMKYANANNPDRTNATRREQPGKQEQAADKFEHPGHADKREHPQVVEVRDMREAQKLCRGMLDQEERGDDPKDRERALGPGFIGRERHQRSYPSMSCAAIVEAEMNTWKY